MINQISEAINNRNLIEFYHDGMYRLVEPFTIGISHKGKTVLSAYQIDGEAHGRNVPDWGLFGLEKITGLLVLDQNFSGDREGYRRSDSRMSHIYNEI